jgi:fructokinase
MNEPRLILGIGELLWDNFPAEAGSPRVPIPGNSSIGLLGGAPANFAVMAGRLGSHAAILSRIGRDDPGRKAIEMLVPLPVDEGHLQIDPQHETGQVSVCLTGGQPEFNIHQPAAWDFLELSSEWVQLAERADAICFGTLAQRSPQSRQTIQELVAQTSSTSIRVFDVNLRPPFYSAETVEESLELATVFKMSQSELPLVLALVGLGAQDDDPAPEVEVSRRGAARLLAEFPSLTLVAITCGSQGSLLVTRDRWHQHPGIPVRVADAVGAGDAFTAALVHYLLRGADLPVLNEAGNRWGSWLASQPGGMPPMPDPVRSEISSAIEGREFG